MKILGISAFYHDSAAALIIDGEIIAAAQEERFTRKKQDASFPKNAIKYCLEYSGVNIDELDAVVFYDKPLLKFERLLETYYEFAPKGLRSFIAAMPVWLKEKMFLKKIIWDELKNIQDYDKKKLKLLFPEHHLSHAASAFYPSRYKRAAILTIDGVGEWATASICLGDMEKITTLKELQFPHSIGLLYSSFTYFLGFKVNSGEYKLMGLAPYGNPDSDEVKKFVKLIKENLVDIKEDGSIRLNQKYFSYATGLKMIYEKKWEKLFGIPTRQAESEFEQVHCNLGLAIQQVTEEIVLKMAAEAKRITKADYLCMAGGVALNCVANGKVLNSGLFKEVFIQPAAGDAGGALGAAMAAHYIYFKQRRKFSGECDEMKGAYLGPEFSTLDVKQMARQYGAVYQAYPKFKEMCHVVAEHLNNGEVVGWMQGKMEFGPRALGARSILGDPRNPEMQRKLNLKIKFRESFRPFAPSVLSEDCYNYFEMDKRSPYMLMVQNIQKDQKKNLPPNYHQLPIKEKLYIHRSDLPAITHIDFSARIQTVHKNTNPRYWTLIQSFKERTGCSVVVNTSFNVRGEPIVCTPEDAYRCFMRTNMDYLAIGNILFKKEDQPQWNEKTKWQEEFTLD